MLSGVPPVPSQSITSYPINFYAKTKRLGTYSRLHLKLNSTSMKNALVLSALLLSALSCKKTDCTHPETADQIIFGVSYAECAGDCSRNFLLTSTQVFADNCDYCQIDAIDFQTDPLDNNKFQIAKPLLEVPDELLTMDDTIFGCPGCTDEGGFYLEITKNGEKHVFQWSSFLTDVPANLLPYFDKVAQTLYDLQ